MKIKMITGLAGLVVVTALSAHGAGSSGKGGGGKSGTEGTEGKETKPGTESFNTDGKLKSEEEKRREENLKAENKPGQKSQATANAKTADLLVPLQAWKFSTSVKRVASDLIRDNNTVFIKSLKSMLTNWTEIKNPTAVKDFKDVIEAQILIAAYRAAHASFTDRPSISMPLKTTANATIAAEALSLIADFDPKKLVAKDAEPNTINGIKEIAAEFVKLQTAEGSYTILDNLLKAIENTQKLDGKDLAGKSLIEKSMSFAEKFLACLKELLGKA